MGNPILYSLVTAFSTKAKGGNPAAVVFLDSNLPTDVYVGIARNLNQPISTFVSPSASGDETVGSFSVRYFATTGMEVALCGHGTLAASKAIFERPGLVSPKVKTLEFHTRTMGDMKIGKLGEGVFEMKLPAANAVELSQTEKDYLIPLITRAFGREVNIEYMAKGGKGFEICMIYLSLGVA